MAKKLFGKLEDIASTENLLLAWREFERGKRRKRDVQEFSLRLTDNILALHRDLVDGSYRHGGYQAFNISDPKPRNIHKATVRDRLVHHAIYRVLYPFFDRTFIADLYSCRLNKGTHRALNRFRDFFCRASWNNTRTCWVLKCDIKKFFANIDHEILLAILQRRIANPDILVLFCHVIESFSSSCVHGGMRPHTTMAGKQARPIGLPLGNLTSQLLVNIYMNEFDQFVKHYLKVKHYIRYADDFVIFSHDRAWLQELVPAIAAFLRGRLRLELHPDKLFITAVASGVDFLGWIHFPDHRMLRTATKRRVMRWLYASPSEATLNSYLGLLNHGDAERLRVAMRARSISTGR
jgi:retron-type reverse transcriptase